MRKRKNLLGRKRYPNATKLLITADGGGSNGSRNKGWKQYLQNFANETIVNLIKGTTTIEGLRIDAQLDDGIYKKAEYPTKINY